MRKNYKHDTSKKNMNAGGCSSVMVGAENKRGERRKEARVGLG